MVVSSKQSEVYILYQETRDVNIDITPSALCWRVARQTDAFIYNTRVLQASISKQKKKKL